MCSKTFIVKWLIVSSFSGIGIELGNLSEHRTRMIIFLKLIAHYMYIAYTFS